MAGRGETTRSSFRTIAALMLLPVAGVLVFFLWRHFHDRRVLPGDQAKPAARAAVQAPARHPRAAEPPARVEKPGPAIVLILDDVGFDGQQIDRAMRLDRDLNFAILPNGTRAAEFAKKLDAKGFELLCHLPMEPVGNSASPGANAVLTSMTDEQIAATTRANLAVVPHARGINNHMGSRATADSRVMKDVLAALPDGMYFIDSLTTGRSVAAALAGEMHIRNARRQVFLDDVQTEAAVRRQLATLAATAKARGIAIGIGHPHAVTLTVLEQELPALRREGYRLVRASSAVH